MARAKNKTEAVLPNLTKSKFIFEALLRLLSKEPHAEAPTAATMPPAKWNATPIRALFVWWSGIRTFGRTMQVNSMAKR